MSDGPTLKTDLDRGISLPASWYVDPALMDRERDRIFRRAWQYVGHAEQGRFLARSEHLIVHFQKLVVDAFL